MSLITSPAINLWQKWEEENNSRFVADENIVPLPGENLQKKLQTHLIHKIQIPSSDVKWIYDASRKDLHDKIFSETKSLIRFYFHPRSYELISKFYSSPINSHAIKPTSSPRSYFLGDQIIKTTLPPEPGDYFEKPLTWEQIQRSVYISSYLNKSCPSNNRYGFLRESFGCSLSLGDHQFGYIVREIPDEVLLNKSNLISLVSYLSPGKAGERSLFHIHLSTFSAKEEFLFLSSIVRIIIEGYLFLYWDSGVCIEAHQQNTLLELDPRLNLTGKVFFRDLEGARIDIYTNKISERVSTSNVKLEDLENIFEMKKTSALLSSMPANPRFGNWSGLSFFSYQAFIEKSCLTLIEHHYDELWKRQRKIDFKKMGYKILCETIFRWSEKWK